MSYTIQGNAEVSYNLTNPNKVMLSVAYVSNWWFKFMQFECLTKKII